IPGASICQIRITVGKSASRRFAPGAGKQRVMAQTSCGCIPLPLAGYSSRICAADYSSRITTHCTHHRNTTCLNTGRQLVNMGISSIPTAHVSARDDQRPQDFARMLRRHRSSLKSFLRKRLFNEEEVEDAVQETSLRLFRYQAQHAIESPTALLYRIAERVAVDFQRRAQSHRTSKHFPLDDTRLLSTDPLPEQLASA